MTRYLVCIGLSGYPVRGKSHIADSYGRSICNAPTSTFAGSTRQEGETWTLFDKLPTGNRGVCKLCTRAEIRLARLAKETTRPLTQVERDRETLRLFNLGKGIKGR